MPPVPPVSRAFVEGLIREHKVVLFSKTWCPFCAKTKDLFKSKFIQPYKVELDKHPQGEILQGILKEISGQSSVPNVWINGNHIGGNDACHALDAEGKLLPLVNPKVNEPHDFDYDLVVIGGGSGGLAASKEAAALGKKVAVLDFVKPSPMGTSWGLGGTCVNVGCIPKKLMHHAALLGESIKDAHKYGWEVKRENVNHNWETMVSNVQDYIGGLNWNYKVELRDKSVKYLNSYGVIKDAHTIECTNKRGKVETLTTQNILVATGERPRIIDIPGIEHTISSDDLFSLPQSPGKTLVVGASYVALECAGFLAGIGLDTTVMVRSIFLRGFDQQCANIVGNYLEKEVGCKMIRPGTPTAITKLENGKLKVDMVVTNEDGTKTEKSEEYDTVMMAIGRDPCTKGIGLENVNVELAKSGKVIVNDREETNVEHVYAIGDILSERLELTPVAIQAGRLLSRRLFGGSEETMDYDKVATTVFTPLEYSCCGYSEEKATEVFGADNIEIYHRKFWPLEWTLAGHDPNLCYMKAIVMRHEQDEPIIGLHYVGPQAGEVMQGFSAAMKSGLTKKTLDSTVGIHPVNAEWFTGLDVTKRSGVELQNSGC